MPHDAELRNRLKNVHTYAATPFTDDLLHLDLAGFERNLEFQVEHGMQVIAVGGGTGEIETLTVDELETLVGTALRTVDGRALVIACLPANLGEAVELLAEKGAKESLVLYEDHAFIVWAGLDNKAAL